MTQTVIRERERERERGRERERERLAYTYKSEVKTNRFYEKVCLKLVCECMILF